MEATAPTAVMMTFVVALSRLTQPSATSAPITILAPSAIAAGSI